MIDYTMVLQISEWLGVAAVTTMASLSLRFKRKPLLFEFPLRESIVAGMLYLSILVLGFIYYARSPIPSGFLPAIVQRFMVASICVLPFIAALFIRRQPPLSAGIGKSNLSHSLRLALVLVFLAIFLRGKIYSLINGISFEQGQFLIVCLGVSFLEEGIFRGYIQPRLSAWQGPIPGWIATSILYTIWQVPRLLSNPASLFINLTIVFIQGLLLGWVMLKSGHVVAPAIYRTFSEWMFILG